MVKSKTTSKNDSTPNRKKIKWVRYVLLLMMGVGLYRAVNGPSGAIKLMNIYQNNASEVQGLENLRAQKQRLEMEISKLEKDSAYMEQVARKELGMSKPGEKVFRFMATGDSGKTNKGKRSD